MPVTWPVTHAKKSPRRQWSQRPSYPPFHPTPAGCPSSHPTTPGPTASIAPATSCPGTRGYRIPGQPPSLVSASLWQMPQARTLIRSVPAPGSGIGLSTISSGPPGLDTSTARIVAMDSSDPAAQSKGVYACATALVDRADQGDPDD